MPSVRNISGPYRFFFYSFDCYEAKHVHVKREKMACKFWLDPVVLSKNYGFSPRELNLIPQKIQLNRRKILEAWCYLKKSYCPIQRN